MLTLEVLLGLKSNQGDVTTDYIYTDIGEGENFYVYMPKSFEQYPKKGCNKCLELKKTIYGLHQSPRTFLAVLEKEVGGVCLKAIRI